MFLLPFLFNKAVLISLALIVVGSTTVYGGIKTVEYRDTQISLQEAKQLSLEGKYQEAINKLNTTENKWSTEGVKKEIKIAIEDNKYLIGSSNNYDLGKEMFDKGNYTDALELLKKIDSRNINYSSALSLIELAEKKSTSTPKGEVAGISSQSEVKVKTPPSIKIPTLAPSPTLIPTPTLQPTPDIDPSKKAELENLWAEIKRLTNTKSQAEYQLKIYQDGFTACLRSVDRTINDAPIVEGSKLTYSFAQQNEMRNNCTNTFQPNIDQQTNIYNTASRQLQLDLDRGHILETECPKCWAAVQK